MSYFCHFFQARFLPDRCAAGIALSDDNTVATKTGETSYNTNVVLTRPTPDAQGNLTVTWRRLKGNMVYVGWAVPDLNPNSDRAFATHGSFIGLQGYLDGLGSKVIQKLPSGSVSLGDTVSLRYDPARGTMHVRVNGGAEVLCFTDLRNDLVPAVCLWGNNTSCVVVVRSARNHTYTRKLIF